MKNPFAGILSLFARGTESICGVDFGSSALKVVQLKKKNGQAVLETYGAVALGPYVGTEAGRAVRLSGGKLGEALQDVMREAKITATQCGVAVPMSGSLIASLTLPVRQGQDVSALIPIEARKYIPTPISEVQLDWRVLSEPGVAPSVEQEKTDVLITAVHRDALERLKGVCADAALAPSFFEIESFSTARAAAPAPDAVLGIIDIGASAAKISIVDTGVLRDAHTVNRGGQDMTLALSSSLGIPVAEAEARKRSLPAQTGGALREGDQVASAITARIFGEAREVFAHYEERAGRALGGIVFSGGGALSAGLLAEAEKVFLLPVVLIDPMVQLAAPAFLSPLLARAGPEFAVAIGAALRRLEEVR
ncbi:MAG: type IV pilus assembly protein PilM [Parcubacteria group bacterium Gr01-1014_17]|nr:MAG: type IV pilus assembly protein PilM [Parcubacteria group bacterium Gr01-1014_17]